MASTSRSKAVEMPSADAMIEEFIRLQEAQVTLLKSMFGSSPAAATTPTKGAEGDPEKETLAVRGDSMQSGQDGKAVLSVASMEEAGEISEEESEANNEKDPLEGMHLREVSDQDRPRNNEKDPLEGMHLREVSDQDRLCWKRALGRNDCESLMTQLKEDPSLMMQTLNGRTVLHVASITGCKLLAREVYYDLDDDYYFGGREGAGALILAVDEKTGLTAFDINKYFVGENFRTEYVTQLVKLIRQDIKPLLLDETNREILDIFKRDSRYRFDIEQVEFSFHIACEGVQLERQSYIHYLETVMGFLQRGGGEKLKCLLVLQERSRNPPSHQILVKQERYIDETGAILVKGDQIMKREQGRMITALVVFKGLLQSFPDAFKIFINAVDLRGWTLLHKCAALGYDEAMEWLVKEESIDVNPTLPRASTTPLHLAILHNHPQVVKNLMAKDKIDVNAIFERSIVYGDKDKNGDVRWKDQWSPLQLAAIMGRTDVVRELLTKVKEISDMGKKIKKVVHDDKVSALHMAAASGIPEVLRLFLNDGAFNPLKLTKSDKRSALHFAIDTTKPCLDVNEVIELKGKRNLTSMYAHPVLQIIDFASLCHHTQAIKGWKNYNTMNPKSHWRTKEEYGGKMACITMLLQAGFDVWQQDAKKNYAEPGSEASTDVRLWWYERVAQETLEAKKNLNDAGNAISVVGALVATASCVGPLQPPLGYASDNTDPTNFDLVQATKLMIRVFVVSNCLSFYLAIGSIMFAVVPSLPMPQEGMLEEWQRS